VAEHYGKEYPISDSVIAYDAKKDILVMMLSPTMDKDLLSSIPEIKIVEKDKMEIGEEVFAIGSPLGFENTITNGLLSGIRPIYDSTQFLLQISAPISSGSSGGGIFNARGEIIGISSLYSHGEMVQNLNFAISINDVIETAKSGVRTSHERLTDNTARDLFYQGCLDYLNGDYKDALKNLKESLEADFEHKDAVYTAIGETYLATGDLDSAAVNFIRSIAEKENVEAYMGISKIRLMKGDTTAAETFLQLAIKSDERNVLPMVELGELLFLQGEYSAAVDTLKSAWEKNPHNAKCLALLGYLALKANLYDSAEECFVDALKNQSDNGLALLGLSKIYKHKKEQGKAKDCEKKAYSNCPELKKSKYAKY
jgi:Tfp pilus assembly protein PilF